MPKFVYVAGAQKRSLKCTIRKIRARFSTIPTMDITAMTTSVQYRWLQRVTRQRALVTRVLRQKPIADARARYDIEYMTPAALHAITGIPCRFRDTHYRHWTPLHSKPFLRQLLGTRHRIIEVGSGSGDLIKILAGMNKKVLGVDISKEGCQRVAEFGGKAYCGRLGDKNVVRGVDVVISSYQGDRDPDQSSTIREVVNAIGSRGGRVIVEILLPCKLEDTSGVKYGSANVTRGRTVIGDMKRIIEEYASWSAFLQFIAVGQRLVYSLDGPEVLPSYILVFDVEAESDDGGFTASH